LVPVYGNFRSSIDYFQQGRWVWGSVHAGLAVSDCFLVAKAATVGGRLIATGVSKIVAGEAGQLGKSAAAAVAGALRRKAASQLHHPWSQYLGGAVKQKLQSLPKATHDAFHSGLDKILKRQIRGGATKYYRSLSPAEQAENFQKFMEYTKAFDAKHGTNLWDAVIYEATRTR
jgi:hypothetical protein